MAEKSASPFASLGVDKALLRQTKPPVVSSNDSGTDANGLPDATPMHQPAEPDARRALPKSRKPAAHTDSGIPTNTSQNRGIMVSRYHDALVETIRRAVRVVGKEAATYRYSPEEKARAADIIYSYKRRGIRTSENEMNRIALNFIFQDYDDNGEESILAKVLDALNR
jgi:hypothetical protein